MFISDEDTESTDDYDDYDEDDTDSDNGKDCFVRFLITQLGRDHPLKYLFDTFEN